MSRVGITVEGGLLAADLVERIALGDETVAARSRKTSASKRGASVPRSKRRFLPPGSIGKASSFAEKCPGSALSP
jgi:hypothetical protein